MKSSSKPSRALLLVLVILALASLACNAILRPPQPTKESIVPATEQATQPVLEAPVRQQVAQIAPIVGAQVVYYDIYGSTEQELLAGMQANALQDDTGYSAFALTSWYISWGWPGYGTDNCDLLAATTELDITITMPRWIPPDNPDPRLVETWNRFFNALAYHEQTHVNNATGIYPEVLPAIQNATCLTADQAAHDVLNKLRQADFSYDQETGHGLTEGAHFP